MILGLALTAVFVLLNGFFVAAEFALVKLRATQVQKFARRHDAKAKSVVDVTSHLDRYLSATQLGITLASLGLGSVAEPTVARALEAYGLTFGLTGRMLERLSHALAFSVLTAAHIVLGELLPKLIAIVSAEKVALNVAFPLQMFHIAARPALVLLNGAASLLLKAMGLPSLQEAEGALSEEEILGVLSQAYARGGLSDAKRLLLERVMHFSDRTARQVMVPRLDVHVLDADMPVADAIRRVKSDGFTRYPLVEGSNLDRVVGYVNSKDLVLAEVAPKSMRAVMREAVVVPETMSLFDLMRDLQRRQTPLAIVVDEYGGTSGIATLEDVLEEIVGEIRDEHDEEAPRVVARPDGTVLADGLATANDLSALGVDLGEIESDTVGGAVSAVIGRLARPGDQAVIGGYDVRVDTVRRRRVARVTITKRPDKGNPDDDDE